MRHQIILLLLCCITSCDSAQQSTQAQSTEIQNFFHIKGLVKEIQTISRIQTTMGGRSYFARTTFERSGAPIETIECDSNGKIKNREPWAKVDAGHLDAGGLKGFELKKEFDNNKRMIKSTQYNNGIVAYETWYKYDSLGNKIEQYETIDKKKVEYNYLNKILTEELTFEKDENDRFYLWCKKKFSYDKKSNVTEVSIHRPGEKPVSEKYKYDSQGSLIGKVVCSGDEIIEQTNRKIMYY